MVIGFQLRNSYR